MAGDTRNVPKGAKKGRSPAKKAAPKAPPAPKRMNVYAVPVVEIDVTARCSHGCFVLIPSSVAIFNFTGIGNRIDVGPGGDQSDILIHTHTLDDPELEAGCETDCWGIEDD